MVRKMCIVCFFQVAGVQVFCFSKSQIIWFTTVACVRVIELFQITKIQNR